MRSLAARLILSRAAHLKGRVRERLLHGLEVIAVCRETRETHTQRQHAWRHLTYVRIFANTYGKWRTA